MGLLTSLFRSAREGRSLENPSTPLSAPDDWLYDALGSYRASSGVNVNRETALTYPPVWRCVNLLGRDIAKLPLITYKRYKGGKRPDWRHPAYYLLRRKPNPVMTALTWKLCMALHALLVGNAYSYILRDGAGRPLELIPLSPDRTYPVRENGNLFFVTTVDQGLRKLLPENVLHFKGLSYDGLVGYNVITKMRETLGLGMGMQGYAAIYFRNNAEPRIVLKHPGKLTKEAQTNLRESWERIHTGIENAHRTAILAEGMDVKQISLSARDSQLIDSRQYSLIEVANFFGIPPYKVGAEISTSYKSLEQQQQAYLDEALDPWLVSMEEECWDKLLSEDEKRTERRFIAFDRRQLLRADLATRSAYYVQGLSNGWLNIDEVRDEEDMNPVEGGAGLAHRVPLNLGLLGAPAPEPAPGGAPPAGTDPAATPAPAAPELLDVPDVRQSANYDCGAAACRTVAEYFDLDEGLSEAAFIEALGTTPAAGTEPNHIVDWLTAKGLLCTSGQNMTVEDLGRFFRSGHPVICAIQDYGTPAEERADQSGHYVVVIGVGLGQVFFQDPSAGRVMWPEAQWLAAWHDESTLPDGTPATLTRFGIAVGADLVEQPAESEGDANPDAGNNASGDDTADADTRCGGPGSGVPGPCPLGKEKDKVGGKGGGKPAEGALSEKAQRAKDAHHLVDKDIQRYSEERNEPALAKALGGEPEKDNKEYDVLVDKGANAPHGVELKTMVDNKNSKLTMKGSAQDRKADWEVKNGGTFHTVVYDDQKVYNAKGDGKHGPDKDRDIYYRRGGGSFRVDGMYKAKDHDELNQLIRTPTDKLPDAAKPTKQWQARQQAAKDRAGS